MTDIFEQCARRKVRFPFRGQASAEDLWDVPVEDMRVKHGEDRPGLNTLYGRLARKAHARNQFSLIEEAPTDDDTLDLQIAIVKHIIETKQAEAKARKTEADNRAHLQRLLAVKAQRKEGELLTIPMDDLDEMIANLQK